LKCFTLMKQNETGIEEARYEAAPYSHLSLSVPPPFSLIFCAERARSLSCSFSSSNCSFSVFLLFFRRPAAGAASLEARPVSSPTVVISVLAPTAPPISDEDNTGTSCQPIRLRASTTWHPLMSRKLEDDSFEAFSSRVTSARVDAMADMNCP